MELPAAPKRQMELYDQIRATPDQDEQLEFMREILEIVKKQLYVIGLTQEPESYGIVKNIFRNVPKVVPDTSIYTITGYTPLEQYFVDSAVLSGNDLEACPTCSAARGVVKDGETRCLSM